ncbi:hypothetical protein C6990_02535 [Nitrosopumilus sp. b3]|uniref:hypothetical protein n=1 Tax=Nitrosopumilus sp. b3 TaxID=2109909 RepID=UPI0015F4045A|nr:hypothetical protein [Nitrosopumilus sp. b3]KAF6247363.1 hypothetical protein C6990_02535 [Nitrosopumilus sp. b3]
MTSEYDSFLEELWSEFPGLSEKEITDITDHNILWTLDEYIKAGYVNFKTGRKELYRLSILLENFAVKNNVALFATFETEKRYKYVEDRYLEILEKIPKAWIIGNFNNPFLAQQPPKNSEVISCDGTNISDMWIVITKNSMGPFGLVAENIGDGQYRGFFSISPPLMKKVVENISKSLRISVDLS